MLTDVFKALGDETRLRLFNLLRQRKCCVRDVETILRISQSNASRHLDKLRRAGLLESEKTGQWVYFSINRRFLSSQQTLLAFLDQELAREIRCQKDNLELKKYLHQQQSSDQRPG